ncbi:MAG: hypothetical protein RQ982_10890, partial [Gammaproteobacteria bacterium]|nr:hypothetical protein [Gammaproteobacteria bacterium]
VITPSLSGVIKDNNWSGELKAKLTSYRYSDHSINGDDQFFDVTGRYSEERNIFSLNANYDLSSNLDSTSTAFGIAGRRVEQKSQIISPQYTRLLTERLALMLGYTYTDVNFSNTETTNFTDYTSHTGSGTLIYDLTEKDKMTVSFFAVDYASSGDQLTYNLYMSRFGIDHEFSETLSTDFLIGVSRRKTTNRTTQTFDFFGNVITLEQEDDSNTRGLLFDAGITKKFESSELESRLSRNNNTNSTGGLDQTDTFTLRYKEDLSSLWRYDASVRYQDITSVGSSNSTDNRELLFLETRLFYSITKKWIANASYRYAQIKRTGDTSDNSTPHSNRIFVGITYNFPSLSTF